MKIHAAKKLAEALAALADLLARDVPEIAIECVAFADRLRAWAAGDTVSAGPDKPPPPPPPGG